MCEKDNSQLYNMYQKTNILTLKPVKEFHLVLILTSITIV